MVYLNGLKGDDRFLLEETAGSKIRLKVAGNEGRDIYEVKGRIKNKVLENKPEDLIKPYASTSFAK
jgi:hypothetical protein